MKNIKFDECNPLVGICIKRGTRIVLAISYYEELVDYLSVHHGNTVCTDVTPVRSESALWAVAQLRTKVICVVDESIDVSTLPGCMSIIVEDETVAGRIMTLIEQNMHQKITTSLLRRLMQKISEIAKCGWFDVRIRYVDRFCITVPYGNSLLSMEI